MMEVPSTLAHLIAFNKEYKAVLCVSPLCCRALGLATVVEHLRKVHHEKPAMQKQAGKLIHQLRDAGWSYDWSTIQLPADGSIPQLVLQVVDGFSCLLCKYKTTRRDNMRKHSNKEHLRKRFDDKELFKSARLQTWFVGARQRYWEVDESKEPEREPEIEPDPELDPELELEPERELEPEPELEQLGRLYNATATPD